MFRTQAVGAFTLLCLFTAIRAEAEIKQAVSTPNLSAQDEWNALDAAATLSNEINEIDKARQSLKEDCGRLSRACHLDRDNRFARFNYLIVNKMTIEAADMFLPEFNDFRNAYFTYLSYPIRMQRVMSQIDHNQITGEEAARRIKKLDGDRENAIWTFGFLHSEYEAVIDHLNHIIETNQIVQLVPQNLAAVSSSNGTSNSQATLADTAKAVRAMLLAAHNLGQTFLDIQTSKDSTVDVSLKSLEGPTTEQTNNVWLLEPRAQLATAEHSYQMEKQTHRRMARLNYRMISLLKGFVDSKIVPEWLGALLKDFFDDAYDQRVRDFMRPMIRVVLASKNTGMDLVEEVFELNSAFNDDELLTSIYRVAVSPPEFKNQNITKLWYDMKITLKNARDEMAKNGEEFKINKYGDWLDRMNASERWGKKLRPLSLFSDGMSPMQKRQTCKLALLGTTGFLGYEYWQHHEAINGLANRFYQYLRAHL